MMSQGNTATAGGGEKTLPWILTLFGTAVGAGILYLPLQAGVSGTSGILATLILTLFIFPIVYCSHKGVIGMLTLNSKDLDYAGVVDHYLGRYFGVMVVLVFFITFYAVLFSYIIGLNANIGDYLVHLGLTETNWAEGPLLCLGILLVFALLQLINQRTVLRIMEVLSIFMIFALMGISLYLMPFWSVAAFDGSLSLRGLSADFFRTLPILVLSFVFFPAMSSMIAAFRKQDPTMGDRTLRALQGIVFKTTGLLLFFVLFFVYSCILSLTPEEFHRALSTNLNSLTLLSYKPGLNPILSHIGVIVGLTALFTSFVGVFFAVQESARELLRTLTRTLGRVEVGFLWKEQRIRLSIAFLIYGSLWVLTSGNLSVMGIFGLFVSPLVSIFLFILPVGILIKAQGFLVLRRFSSIFVLLTGFLLLFSYKIGALLEL